MRKEGGAVTKEQKKATRQALRRYGEGSVCAAWAQVIGAVLAWYDRNDPVCAQLLRLRYLQGLPEEKVIARLYVGRTTYYTKELEALLFTAPPRGEPCLEERETVRGERPPFCMSGVVAPGGA